MKIFLTPLIFKGIKIFSRLKNTKYFLKKIAKKFFLLKKNMATREKVQALLKKYNCRFVNETCKINRFDAFCNKNHRFTTDYYKLNTGEWCNICCGKITIDEIKKIIEDFEYDYEEDDFSKDVRHCLRVENNGHIIYFDFLDSKNNLSREKIEDKIAKIKKFSNSYVLINENNIEYDVLCEYIGNCLSELSKINILNRDKYESMEYAGNKQLVLKDTKVSEITKTEINNPPKNYMDQFSSNIAHGYARISLNKADSQIHSIDSQIMLIKNYAKEHKLILNKIFVDEGLSAKNIEGRPALSKLVDQLKWNDKIIIYSLSRLSRDNFDSLYLQKMMKERDCELIILDMPNTSGNEALDEFMKLMQTGMSAYERKQVAKRVSDIMNAQSTLGRIRTKCPYGKKFVAKKIPFIDDEYEQNVIKKIRELRYSLSIPTYTNIAKELEKQGFRPRQIKPKEIKKSNDPIVDYGEDYKKEKKIIKPSKWYPYKIKKIMENENIPLPTKYKNNETIQPSIKYESSENTEIVRIGE